MIEKQDPATPLPGKGRAKHPRRTGADNDCIKLTRGRHERSPYEASGNVRNGWKADIRTYR